MTKRCDEHETSRTVFILHAVKTQDSQRVKSRNKSSRERVRSRCATSMAPRLVFSLACFLVTSTTWSLSFGSSFTSSLSSAPRPFETASEPARRALLSRAGGLLLPLVLQDGARPALAASPSGSKSSKATKGGGGGVATAKTVEELEALPPPPLPAWAVFLSSDARLASAFVYAVTTPVGVPLFAIDLDDKERVRSVGFFFETKAEAEAELRNAKASGAAVASKAVVAAVPLPRPSPAYQPVSKRTGFPGYFCHRFRLSPEVKADAPHLSGLAGFSTWRCQFSTRINGPLFLRLSDLAPRAGRRRSSSRSGSSSSSRRRSSSSDN